GAASPQPVMPASVSSLRMAFFTEPPTSPEPWRRISRTGMSVTKTVIAVILICFKANPLPAPRTPAVYTVFTVFKRSAAAPKTVGTLHRRAIFDFAAIAKTVENGEKRSKNGRPGNFRPYAAVLPRG